MRRQHYYYPHHPAHHHGQQGYSTVSSSQPPALLRGSTIPLPAVRLGPLQPEDEVPLPPVPFVVRSRELNQDLRYGGWRRLPERYGPHGSNHLITINDELLGPATSRETRELMMVVNAAGQPEREVLVHPRMGGSAVVSVLDVINAVEAELWRAERRRPAGGAYYYIGQTACREQDGIWRWRGLVEAKDEHDVWILYL